MSAETKTITRIAACPICLQDMTMEIDIETGYGRGIYICTCGYQACQSQEGNDWREEADN